MRCADLIPSIVPQKANALQQLDTLLVAYSKNMSKTPKNELSAEDGKQIAKALQILFATDYISRKKLYWENFVRGFTMSIGTILGATVGLALLLWILSLFKTVPLIGPLVRHAQQTIQSTTSR